jgi:hypothetical protein
MGILTKHFKIEEAENLIDAVANNEVHLYAFAARATPYNNESIADTLQNNYFETQILPVNELMFGKKIYDSNIKLLIKNNAWQANTVYKQYSQNDSTLYDGNMFFVSVYNSGVYKIYKCLYNNKSAPSSISPSGTSTNRFTTADGYTWKYMFSVSDAEYLKFGFADYIPVITDVDVVNSANDGIEIIDVIAGGNGYFATSNGFVIGTTNTTTVQIEISNNAHLSTNFFSDSAFYITAGPGAGFYSKIASSFTSSQNLYLILNTEVGSIVPQLSQYYISPEVQILGDGRNAKAISVVNTNLNHSISSINIIDGGYGYTRARATINSTIGVGANVVVYTSPFGGHGSDAAGELGAEYVAIQTDFLATDNLPENLTFRNVGILKNPIASNGSSFTANTFNQLFVCNINPSGAEYVFTIGEEVIGADSIGSPESNGAIGIVVASNSTSLSMVGDKHFSNLQIITGQTSNVTTVIYGITRSGDLRAKPTANTNGNQVLYINNMLPVHRSNTSNELVKLAIKL